jgi:hypothetical protein
MGFKSFSFLVILPFLAAASDPEKGKDKEE